MTKGGLLFVIIVGGYILFELSLLHKLGYRTEVDHILGQMVPAQEAVNRCGQASAAQQEKFARRMATLQTRAVRELEKAEPGLGEEQATAQFAAQVRDIRRSAEAAIAEQGCNSPDVVTMLRRYTIYAGKA